MSVFAKNMLFVADVLDQGHWRVPDFFCRRFCSKVLLWFSWLSLIRVGDVYGSVLYIKFYFLGEFDVVQQAGDVGVAVPDDAKLQIF